MSQPSQRRLDHDAAPSLSYPAVRRTSLSQRGHASQARWASWLVSVLVLCTASSAEASESKVHDWLRQHKPVALQHLLGVSVGRFVVSGSGWPTTTAEERFQRDPLALVHDYLPASGHSTTFSSFYTFYPLSFLGLRVEGALIPMRFSPGSLRIEKIRQSDVDLRQLQLRAGVVARVPMSSLVPTLGLSYGRSFFSLKEQPQGPTIARPFVALSFALTAHINDFVFVRAHASSSISWFVRPSGATQIRPLTDINLAVGVSYRHRRSKASQGAGRRTKTAGN